MRTGSWGELWHASSLPPVLGRARPRLAISETLLTDYLAHWMRELGRPTTRTDRARSTTESVAGRPRRVRGLTGNCCSPAHACSHKAPVPVGRRYADGRAAVLPGSLIPRSRLNCRSRWAASSTCWLTGGARRPRFSQACVSAPLAMSPRRWASMAPATAGSRMRTPTSRFAVNAR